jgi:5-(carboxyamino)imidazole ribonucleotide synthase
LIPPGKKIGIVGGGGVGEMLARAAGDLGYGVHVHSPAAFGSKGGDSWDDTRAFEAFARAVDLVAVAAVDLPEEPLAALAAVAPVRPSVDVLRVGRSRLAQKRWLKAQGFAQPDFAEVLDGDMAAAIARVGRPCVVKSADFRSDEPGLTTIRSPEDLERAEADYHERSCIVERWIDFRTELCVLVARTETGECRAYPLSENIRRRLLLNFTITPARVIPAVASEAEQIGTGLAHRLGVAGVIAVEMFLSHGSKLLVKEVVPLPDEEAGGWLDRADTSPFEQHIRALCGLPLGSAALREPTVAAHLWEDERTGDGAREPDWNAILAEPRAKLHLHGAIGPRSRRKRGCFTVRAPDVDSALARAEELKAQLDGV